MDTAVVAVAASSVIEQTVNSVLGGMDGTVQTLICDWSDGECVILYSSSLFSDGQPFIFITGS